MRINKTTVQIKEAVKFHCSAYFRFFFKSGCPICHAKLIDKNIRTQQWQVLSRDRDKVTFSLQVFLKEERFPTEATLLIKTSRDKLTINVKDLLDEAVDKANKNQVSSGFYEHIHSHPGLKLLDLGGRNRSGKDWSSQFPCETTVFDILPGENVDVVGDAHELSKYFPANTFDAVFCVAVFEHLLMPWKAVLEINKVLKTGGVGLVFTHQTIQLHDPPWDFWRYSDNAWDGLFNRHTGFEILERAMYLPNCVLPRLFREGCEDVEQIKGYEGSSVLFRKVSGSSLDWDTPLQSIVATAYPV